MMFTKIKQCRNCQSNDLTHVLSLGNQCLSGVFPKEGQPQPECGPLNLVLCNKCGLLQMEETYSLSEMYGENYGYRSGLNSSMVEHLQRKIRKLEEQADIEAEDIVLDIGSNDATGLKSYTRKCIKMGMDPTGIKFSKYYTDDILLLPTFFNAESFFSAFPKKKARLITSIAMFYDLPEPDRFVEDISKILAPDGIWHFEQSYMPQMLKMNAFDTVCHEHLEFYSLTVINALLTKHKMRITDLEFNDINGGSFAITACHENSKYPKAGKIFDLTLETENALCLNKPAPYLAFYERIQNIRKNLLQLLSRLHDEGKVVFGYGASTKGNVLLQYCGIGRELLPCIGEVNTDKFGACTPGTKIPIISEAEAKKRNPDYFLVLPWHFREGILEKEKEYRMRGGKFIFPLPEIEIV